MSTNRSRTWSKKWILICSFDGTPIKYVVVYFPKVWYNIFYEEVLEFAKAKQQNSIVCESK